MTTRQKVAFKAFGAFAAAVLATSCVRTSAQTVKMPVDPGVRGGAAGAGSSPERPYCGRKRCSFEMGSPGSLISRS